MPRNIAQIVDNSIPFIATSVEPHFARLEAKLKRELGETILQLLVANDTEDIVLNPDSSLWVKRMSKNFQQVGAMAPAQAASALNTLAAWKGTVMNHDRPVLETELPLDGSRLEGIVSPVVRNPIFAIRLRPKQIFTLSDYESTGIITGKDDTRTRTRAQRSFAEEVRRLDHADVIRAAIQARKNILVVGATGSGKTTLVNLNVQPTIKIPVGYRFNVRVNRDVLFEAPYKRMS